MEVVRTMGKVQLQVPLDPKSLGAALAHAGDDEQAAAINEFLVEFRRSCATFYDAQMQITCIRALLSPAAKQLLEMPDPEGS